jgi:magnesium-dependent phosphatase 1
VKAGSDVVRLFPGALAVIRTVLADKARFGGVQVAVASSTTRPAYANACLDKLVIDPDAGTTLGEIVQYREIFPGSKGSEHLPNLARKSGLPFSSIVFWDDCIYGDNCGDVARKCEGVVCVRTPNGMTENLFEQGLSAFARGASGVL